MKQHIIHTVGCFDNEVLDANAARDRLMELFSQGYEVVRSIEDISGRVFITVREVLA